MLLGSSRMYLSKLGAIRGPPVRLVASTRIGPQSARAAVGSIAICACNSVEQQACGLVFHHDPARALAKGPLVKKTIVEAGANEYLRFRQHEQLRKEVKARLSAEIEVEQYDVGLHGRPKRECSTAVASLTGYGHAGPLPVDQPSQSPQRDLLIVDEQHSNRRERRHADYRGWI